jgi:hypothetical protein
MNAIRSSLLAAVLAAAPAGALACTGSSADPVHCINNNQAINGFGEFYSRNLQPLSTQNPDDASDFAYIAPRVGALSSGLLHSNYALYADSDEEYYAVYADLDGEAPETRQLPYEIDDYKILFDHYYPAAAPEGDLSSKPELPAVSHVPKRNLSPPGPGPATSFVLRFSEPMTVPSVTGRPDGRPDGRPVGGITWLNRGQAIDLVVVEQPDGKLVGVGPDGHVFGDVRQSRSGFGWRFEGPVTPPPGATGGRVLDGR